MLQLGDIRAARLLFHRAALGGSGVAALEMAQTYDPAFLAKIGAADVHGELPAAAEWYKRALSLGREEARAYMAQLGRVAGK